MKQLILAVANQILDAQGTVTTLEVKNRARIENSHDSNFRLTQLETSNLLNELSNEEGWDFKIETKNGNSFRVYTRGSVGTAAASTGTSASQQVATTPSGNVPSEVNGSTIVYLSGKPQIWFQTFTADKNVARSEANRSFRQAGHYYEWNDLNVATTKYFAKKYAAQL